MQLIILEDLQCILLTPYRCRCRLLLYQRVNTVEGGCVAVLLAPTVGLIIVLVSHIYHPLSLKNTVIVKSWTKWIRQYQCQITHTCLNLRKILTRPPRENGWQITGKWHFIMSAFTWLLYIWDRYSCRAGNVLNLNIHSSYGTCSWLHFQCGVQVELCQSCYMFLKSMAFITHAVFPVQGESITSRRQSSLLFSFTLIILPMFSILFH